MKDRIKEIFLSWTNFKQVLQQIFKNINETRTTKRNFQELRQSKLTLDYVVKFQQYAVKTKWDDKAFIAQYYIKLKKKIKNVIVWNERFTKLQNMIKNLSKSTIVSSNGIWKKKNGYHDSMYKKKYHNERKIYSIQIKLNAVSKFYQKQIKRSRIDEKEKFKNKF